MPTFDLSLVASREMSAYIIVIVDRAAIASELGKFVGKHSTGVLRATMLSAFFALTGCGADGGSSVNSTPPPPIGPSPTTVTPANLSPSTSFTNSMQSGSFVTISQSDSSTGTVSGNTTTYAHNYSTISNVAISYDAPSNTYALNYTDSNGKSQSSPLNANSVSAGQGSVQTNGSPDPTEVSYNQNGCSTATCQSTTALVTHTGSGGFVYSYVAFASIQSVTTNNASGGSSLVLSQAVFGVPTPVSAVPQTGSAAYKLDLIGTYNGTGTGTVNFGAGTYSYSGNITPSGVTSGTFSSTGTLTSSGNGFSGTINLQTFQEVSPADGSTTTNYSGKLGGMFFGPQAQELGGSFIAPATSATTTTSSSTIPIASIQPIYGVILGHK